MLVVTIQSRIMQNVCSGPFATRLVMHPHWRQTHTQTHQQPHQNQLESHNARLEGGGSIMHIDGRGLSGNRHHAK